LHLALLISASAPRNSNNGLSDSQLRVVVAAASLPVERNAANSSSASRRSCAAANISAADLKQAPAA